ncbi:MAG: phosphoserine phosphatase SerB [Alphaproteobacteria bacterium]|nr:phosphoserine phosphatase SerB [Alphaproteobacteria bacterium]
MQHVLVLICDPERPALDETRARAVAAALRAAGARVDAAVWLAAGVACDLPFSAIDPAVAQDAASAALEGAPIDAVAVPTAGRRKRLLVCDMESTIIENEMLDELADFLGLRARVAAITARAMNGEIDFQAALAERVGLLKGLPVSTLDEAATRIRVMPGATALIATMRLGGAYCALVSGGFTHFTRLVRGRLGFDLDAANTLEVAGDTLAGTVAAPVLGKEAKLATLALLCEQKSIAVADSMAVGDGANDLPMLQGAGLGVAFRAKPAVAAAVGARVDHGDLTALLYLQGYRRSDFVTRSPT